MDSGTHAVVLEGQRVGSLLQRGDFARFVFREDYWENPNRPVLGLWFEDNPRKSPQAALRLPPWFSNLLPEGPLRDWIAFDRGVSVDRELQLLLQIGADLPGGVQVETVGSAVDPDAFGSLALDSPLIPNQEQAWKFSLAGVGLKFSMLRRGDRLSIPAYNELGDWIVKFPDAVHRDVPANEFATMSMAREVGIDCPDFELVHRDDLPVVSSVMWPGSEDVAYAISRFDRSASHGRVHMEDLAQVRGWYPNQKYDGSFETVAALIYRRQDRTSLREFVRRLTFNILVGNGDAHLKNWSLLYKDSRRPAISPAYDLVSTAGYYNGSSPEDLGLKLGGSKLAKKAVRGDFIRMQRILKVDREDVIDVVDETVDLFRAAWRGEARERFPLAARDWISDNFEEVSTRLTGRLGS
jgi:serine/threonine-protein kinase HipA